MAGPAQGQHFYTFSKKGKQNETYTRHTRVVRLGRFARRRNDHSLDTDSQRNNKDYVMTIEEFLKELKDVVNIYDWYPDYKYLDDMIGGASIVTGNLETVIKKYEEKNLKGKEV